MRFPRITVRRLMIVVGGAALLVWCGMMAWRWQHFRALARHEMRMAEHAAEREQRIRKRVAIYQEGMTVTDRELDQMRREDGPQLTGPEHELIEAQIKLFEWNKNRLKGSMDKTLREAEEFEKLRIAHEASGRRYQAMASRPWALNQHDN